MIKKIGFVFLTRRGFLVIFLSHSFKKNQLLLNILAKKDFKNTLDAMNLKNV